MNKNIFLFLEEKMELTNAEQDFINRINDMLADQDKLFENFNFYYDKILYTVFYNIDLNSYNNSGIKLSDFNFKFNSIKILPKKELSFTDINNLITTYQISNIYLQNEMPVQELIRFIKDRNISYGFVSDSYMQEKLINIDKLQLSSFLGSLCVSEFFKQCISDIMIKDIEIYNSLIGKITTDLPYMRTFLIINDGMKITAKEEFSYIINIEVLLKYIFFINLENIAVALEKRKRELDQDLLNKKREFENRKTIKLQELKRTIVSDDKFKLCTNIDMRIRYLKDLLLDENDEVLEYFNMSRQMNRIIANGNEAKFWIENIWKDLNKNK